VSSCLVCHVARTLCGLHWAKHQVGGTGKGNHEFGLKIIFVYTSKGSLACYNLMTWGLQLYFPSEKKHSADFYCI
jgi:hypothetical protein